MRRILIVILLAVLLLPARPPGKPDAVRAGPLLVKASPLPLTNDGVPPTRSAPLSFQGGWTIKSDNAGFGGLSALLADADGRLLALSDGGVLMGFHVGPFAPTRRAFIAPLPIAPADQGRAWWEWDSESLTHDPVTDRYWVGFESQQRICRYSSGFARVERCRVWRDIRLWPDTGSIESLARLPDGRFLAISEMGITRQGDHDALLFAGDPTEKATLRPIHLRYAAPRGYHPTDAFAIDARHLLVLNRRLSVQDLFTATIAIVTIPEHIRQGARLEARVLLRLAPPLLADNFEGISVTREGERIMVWVISDDNHQVFQRTLLLKFELRKDLLH